ncbi:MAG: hypothetical protein OIF32_11700, partial [Campylobacterales bacterium]|nr:hypothetical protein [Campylobacterales bacterium]
MKIYSLLTALILFNIGFYGCIEESAESTDNSKEPICSTSSYTSSCQFRYLEEIQGKTLSFKYKLGSKSYVDDIKLDNEPRYYNDINIKAFLDGTIIYEGNTRKVLCWYA